MAEVTGLKLLLPGGPRADGSDGVASVLRGHSRLCPLPGDQCGGVHVGARFADDEGAPLEDAGIDPQLLGTLGPTARYAFAAGLFLLEELGLAGRGGGWALPPGLREGTGVVYTSSLAHGEAPPGKKGSVLPALLGANVQLAQLLQARGPNCATTATCASTTAALKLACNFLAAGDAERVLVIAADLALHKPGVVASFLSIKAASAADAEGAVLPFGARRNGLVFGEGALAILVEAPGGARPPLARVAGVSLANSAFHGTRIDPGHVAAVIGKTVARVAAAEGLTLEEFAAASVYVAHETFTLLCSTAEVAALERVFGRETLRRIPITGTKRLTGHCMSVGVEDAIAVACLGAGALPGTPARDIAPEFADLALHGGGPLAFRFAMHLSLGFGSQVAFVIYAKAP